MLDPFEKGVTAVGLFGVSTLTYGSGRSLVKGVL